MMPQYNKIKGRTLTPQKKEPEKEEEIEGLEFLYK